MKDSPFDNGTASDKHPTTGKQFQINVNKSQNALAHWGLF